MMRWRKEPRARGLAAVTQGTRGYELWDGGERLATVSPSGGSFLGPLRGWYWYGGGVNSFPKLFDTPEKAKEEALAHIKSILKEKQP